MSLNIKIDVPATGLTKVFRFNSNLTIYEACKDIKEKVGVGGADHGLFEPSGAKGKTMGKFLAIEKTFDFYDISNNDTLQYRKKHEVIKVKLIDDTVKAVLVDLSAPINEVVDTIGEKCGLKHADEFSLQAEGRPGFWLKTNLSLTEQVSTLDQSFIMKKKYFVYDGNVDQDDPFELHLVYCQSKEDIIHGNHPTTKEEAIQFASLQLQVDIGNMNPEIHERGKHTLDWKRFVSPEHKVSKEMERLILDEWKKLVSMTAQQARMRYIQCARTLKTYGMTLFKVKEKVEGKKKLFDALLGFTRDSIIRMNASTRVVFKQHPLKHLLRWAATPDTFTMDFGSHEEDYVVVVTQQGEQISTLIAGYIDLLMKKRVESDLIIDEDNNPIAAIDTLGHLGAQASLGQSATITISPVGYSQSIQDLPGAREQLEKMANDLFGAVTKMDIGGMTPDQRRQQVADHAKQLGEMTEKLMQLAKQGDRQALNMNARDIVSMAEQMIKAARAAAASGADPNGLLLGAAKGVAEALQGLMSSANYAAQNPNDPAARDALLRAQLVTQAEVLKLRALAGGLYEDDNFQKLFLEMGNSLCSVASEMLVVGSRAANSVNDPLKKAQLVTATTQLSDSSKNFGQLVEIVAPTASDPKIQEFLERAGKGLETSALFMVATGKTAGIGSEDQGELTEAASRLASALNNLISASNLPNIPNSEQAEAFTEGAQEILTAVTTLMVAEGNPHMIAQGAEALKKGTHKLGMAAKSVIPQQSDPQAKERATNYMKDIVNGTKNLLVVIPKAQNNPKDARAFKELLAEAQSLAEITQQLLGDTGKQVAIGALYNSAKQAAADTTTLASTARLISQSAVADPATRKQLEEASLNAGNAVAKLIGVLKEAAPQLQHAATSSGAIQTFSARHRATIVGGLVAQLNEDVLRGAEQFAPVAFKLVSGAKLGSGNVTDNQQKQNLIYNSTVAAKSIQKMLLNRKAMKSVKGQLETAQAMEEYKAALTELESAIISADTGILPKAKISRDQALEKLHEDIISLGINAERVIQAAKSSPEDLGAAMKELSKTIVSMVDNGTQLACNIEDKTLQKVILNNIKLTTEEVKGLYQFAKAASTSPEDKVVIEALTKSGLSVAEALKKLREAASGILPSDVENNLFQRSSEIEDLAEKELIGAANVIESCVLKLQQATENARRRAQERDIDIDEQNITEAILEAAQAIAKSTGVLVQASTQVQREFNTQLKQPKTGQSYHRDPQWAEGLISAAKMVAGSVQHLVKGANEAASGQSSEEALVVSAQAVSSATTQLVTASTVKADPNSPSQIKLREAASKVGAATRLLVKAAKDAAKWEEEKTNHATTTDQYNLPMSKIQEMEKQMEILRLEKELERKRNEMLKDRTAQYSNSGSAAGPAPANKAPAGPVTGLKPALKVGGVTGLKPSLKTGPVLKTGGKPTGLKPAAKSGVAWEASRLH